MTTLTPTTNRRLHAVLNEHKLDSDSQAVKDIVLKHTNGRTPFKRFLTEEEANSMILAFNIGQYGWSPKQKMKRKIIAIAYGLKWVKPNGKIDMGALNKYCKQYSAVKKSLNQHSESELVNLVSQFEQLRRKDKS
ncbi:MAG: hypothetical protein AAF587_29485 [Bacteroidota bacterium]